MIFGKRQWDCPVDAFCYKKVWSRFMKCIRLSFCGLLILALFSCSRNNLSALKEIDALLSDEKSLAKGEGMLDSIAAASSLRTQLDSMYFKLLRLKVEDMRHRQLSGHLAEVDSLVRVAEDHWFSLRDDGISAETYYYAGRVHLEAGDIPQALAFFQKAEMEVPATDYVLRTHIHSQKANIYKQCGLYRDAMGEMEKNVSLDSLRNNQRGMEEGKKKLAALRSIPKEVNDSTCVLLKNINGLYDNKRKNQELHELRANNALQLSLLFSNVIAILSVVVVLVLLFVNRRLSKRNLLLKWDKYENMKEVSARKKGNEQLIMESEIYLYVKNEELEGSFRMSDEQWKQLEKVVNEAYPHFTQNLRSFYEVSPHELHVCLLIKIAISPSSIAKFTAHSKEAITSVRSRLYSKTFHQKGGAPKWDEFIRTL